MLARKASISCSGSPPACPPGWRGWPSAAHEHRFDAVALGSGSGALLEWDEGRFGQQASAGPRPIVAWGVANRPAYGVLVAGSAMLARSFPGHGPIRPLALVGSAGAEPNTAPAFFARGINIVAVPDEVVG